MVAIKDRKIAFPRRPEELYNPDLPPHAEENKNQQVLAVRVDRDLKKEFEDLVKATGGTKRAVMEEALHLLLNRKAGLAPGQ